jgi:hypothetical protein
LHRETAKLMRASGCSRSSTTFASSGGERASRRRRRTERRVLVAHRTNPLPLPPRKGMTLKRLQGRSPNAVRGAEGARQVLLLARGEAEEAEAEGQPGVRELGPRASANEVSLLVVVAKVWENRTCARLARHHLHLAEQHLARGREHDPLLEERFLSSRRQDFNLSLTTLYGIMNITCCCGYSAIL